MNRFLKQPRFLFGLFTLLVVVVFGAAWLREGPSIKEIFLPLSKVIDFERGCLSVHGLVWWTPNYLQGQTCAGFWSTPLSLALLEAGRLVLFPFTALVAYKVVALLALAAAGWAMYGFVLELTGSAWTAMAAGIFYLLCPEPSLRLGQAEHLAFGGAGLCFAFPPLIFRALLRLQKAARDRDFSASRLELSLWLGAFFLMATKMAVLSLPLFCVYALWLVNDLPEPSDRVRFFTAAFLGGLWGGLLGGIPLFPLLREEKWMTLFSTDPFTAWQIAFGLKSGLSFFDRGFALLRPLGAVTHFSSNAFYIGLLWGLALAGALLEVGPWRGWLHTPRGRLCRLFLSLTLLFAWLSFGLCSPWIAHGQLMSAAGALSDWAAPLLWVGLAALIATVHRVASFWHRSWIVPLAVSFVFLFGSGFAAINCLPPFDQIRAPAAFWTLNGSFCIAVAGALALRGAVERLTAFHNLRTVRTAVRGLILAVVALFLWVDFIPYHAEFSKKALAPGIYADYLKAAAFLRQQPWGYVQPVSGRYFYLNLPQLADKPLTCEAATSYFQPRWIRPYQNRARQDPEAFTTFLRASGTPYVLVDRLDPSFDPHLFGFLKQNRPLLYENSSFSIFGCPGSIAPALATGRVVLPPPGTGAGDILEATSHDLWPVESGLGAPIPLPTPGASQAHSQLLSPAQPREQNYQTIVFSFTPPGQPWVIVPESYHPDWQAESDGKPVPVYRAVGCLLAARAAHDGAGVTFHFKQPWWYNGCILLAALSWAVSLWFRSKKFLHASPHR